MLDAGQARNATAVLSSIDDMPSASDFQAASVMPDFEAEDVELDVPPQGQIPELEGGESSQAAWREETRPATAKQDDTKE